MSNRKRGTTRKQKLIKKGESTAASIQRSPPTVNANITKMVNLHSLSLSKNRRAIEVRECCKAIGAASGFLS